MAQKKKDTQSVPEELAEQDIESVVGGQTVSLGDRPSPEFKPNLIGFQEPLVGKVKKVTDEQDYPIEHGI